MKYLPWILALFLLVNGCNEDLGNYDYDYDNAPRLIIDTTGTDKTFVWGAWNIGDTVRVALNVTYPGREANLVYRWFVIDYPYQTVTVGNAQVWPAADTISRDRDLEYIVDLKPGRRFALYFMARDTVNGVSVFYDIFGYKVIPEAGAINGIYCLQEKEGRVDIDVIGSVRALVIGGDHHEVDYYSSLHPGDPLTGAPRVFEYSTTGRYFYIFTDDVGLRVSPTGMTIMEQWEEMFYSPPLYRPQAVIGVNNCDFLVNDGKLHVHYIQSAGERKFTVPIPGDYNLAPFLASRTIATSAVLPEAISAYQILYDRAGNAFRPFFNRGVSIGRFSESAGDAIFDVNNMPGEVVYANTVNGSETMIVSRDAGLYNMHVACFYNVADDGHLARYTRPLAGCEGIANATCFASGLAGPALFYGAGNRVHSYSYTTGQTASNLLWEGDAAEEITALCLLGTGGFPTSGRILWIAAWNPVTQQGRLVEFEINPVSGVAEALYAPMFSGIPDNPVYHEGMGKVLLMTQRY
ncbi:MAG: hypothetical protein LBI96_01920 [Odoribacteraceae bacterium]|jgi:hypothetical protein|nr:hypothetical protein [Odoribacteraceae bacterium]